MKSQQEIVLGVIVGNRNFFPDSLITQGRQDILTVLNEQNIEAVILDEQATNLGAVETWANAQKCAALFDENRHRIDGILITLPNFGDEKGIADTIQLSGLRVPILVQAYPDDLSKFAVELRRDAFCGKISVCNNLYQYGYPFSLTELHTVHPVTDSFRADIKRFAAVCRVVRYLKNARLGAYRLLVKGVTIFRGDGKPIARDLQLGNLRDSYYEHTYGSLEPPVEASAK